MQILNHKLRAKMLAIYLIVGLTIWISTYIYISYSWQKDTVFYWQLLLSRLALISFSILTIIWIVRHWRSFFEQKGSAYNLAIFRIIFFGFFAVGFLFAYPGFLEYLSQFAELPESARVHLPGMQWLVNITPVSTGIVKVFLFLFGLSAISATIGFKKTLSVSIFVIAGLYLFAIPNFYGKINHNHHIVWFAAILIFSPCADVWSADNWWSKRKGNEAKISNEKNYQQPFLWIWLLMGLIYFFPGFWKVWTSGLDWALTENVQNHMYWKWHELGDWEPFFRIDQYPFLYKLVGLFTILFELLFLWLIVNRKTRTIGAISGLLFHLGTWAFMNIFFVILVLSYISFINWEKMIPDRFKRQHSYAESQGNQMGLKIVGILLIIGNLGFGIFKVNSWPFTVYPVFDSIVKDHTKTLSYSYSTVQIESVELNKDILKESFTSERYRNMEHQIIQSFEENRLDERMSLLKSLIEKFELPNGAIINVYLDEVSVNPDDEVMVLDRQLIYSE